MPSYALQGERAHRLFRDIIRDPDLAALWMLNESAGLVAYDRCTKNIINGTLVNTPTLGVDLGNGHKGMTFAAANTEGIALGTPPALAFNMADLFSVVAFASVNNTAATKAIVGRSEQTSNEGWILFFSATEHLTLLFEDSGGGATVITSDAPLATGTVHMLGFSYAGSAASVRFYHNGAILASTITTDTMITDPNYTGIAAGIGHQNAASAFHDGSIGPVAVFSAAKTAQDFRRWAYQAGLL